jgi:TetR/AcrR family transcriptional regulator, fatty acid metabolism regulator protein
MQEDDCTSKGSKRGFIETARRAQIVDCATDVIAELGYTRTSLAQIAKRADVSTGVILYYFHSKEELVQEVRLSCTTFFENFIKERIDAATATSALRSFVRANVALLAAYPKKMLAVRHINFATIEETGLKPGSPMEEPRKVALLSILRRGQEAGEFRSFDPPTVVLAIMGALNSIPWQYSIVPDLNLDLYTTEIVELFHRAIRADNAEITSSPAL